MTLKDKKKKIEITATPDKHLINVKRRKRRQYLKRLKYPEDVNLIQKLFSYEYDPDDSTHIELGKICTSLVDKILKYEYTFSFSYFDIKGFEYNSDRDCYKIDYSNKIINKETNSVSVYTKSVNIFSIDDINVFLFGVKTPWKSTYRDEPIFINKTEYDKL